MLLMKLTNACFTENMQRYFERENVTQTTECIYDISCTRVLCFSMRFTHKMTQGLNFLDKNVKLSDL